MTTALFTHTGSPDVEPEVAAHNRMEAQVVRPLTRDEVDEEVGPMFRIQFADGYETDAFPDELLCLHDGEDASDCPLAG